MLISWCPGAESNHRHCDFQLDATIRSTCLKVLAFLDRLRARVLSNRSISVKHLATDCLTGFAENGALRRFASSSGTIAALYVDRDGAYSHLEGVDLWDQARDARMYDGPWPVVAHPPCQRWGRFWHGSTRKPHQFRLGDDDGCFAAALEAVRRFGGVLEHPADSHAWAAFNLNRPPRSGGWIAADMEGGWTCHVEQGHYGHFSRKPTWLYAVGCELPNLIWGAGAQRLHPIALERHGYAKARRIGMAAMIGGKHKTRIREATPEQFRDVLLEIARSASPPPLASHDTAHEMKFVGCSHG